MGAPWRPVSPEGAWKALGRMAGERCGNEGKARLTRVIKQFHISTKCRERQFKIQLARYLLTLKASWWPFLEYP